jgi:hypothetical protein
MSRRLRRLALIVAAIAALGTCKPVQKTTQEVYTMSGSGTWNQGVVFTASVPLVLDTGSYHFAFKFANSVGQPVVGGAAVGSP